MRSPIAALALSLVVALTCACSDQPTVEVETTIPVAEESTTAAANTTTPADGESQVAASALPEVVYYMLSDA